MLLMLFPSLKESKVIKTINVSLNSIYYILFIGIGTLLCNIIGFEIPWYYTIVVVGLIIPALFSEDLLAMVAPLSMTYSSVSMKNNSIKYNTSLFKGSNFVHLIILISIIVVFLSVRIIFDIIKNKERQIKPALLWGYVVLFFAYLFGGLLSPYYEERTIAYSLVSFFCVCIFYFILLYAVNWNRVPKEYYFWIMLVYGLVVSVQVFHMYAISLTGSDAFTSFDGHMYTGWGMKNNIAAQIALCVTAPTYLAIKNKKFACLFLLAPFVMVTACLLTNSRGGTIFSLLLFVISLVIYFVRSDKSQTIQGLVTISCFVIAAAVFFIIKKDVILASHIFSAGSSSGSLDETLSGRITTWIHGIEHFSENELFGVGFYQCHDYKFVNIQTGFIPPRYHAIYIQFLASLGLFGLLAYFIHRYQTLKLTFKNPTLEKTFIFFTVAALIATSWFDNHFFNFGPGINYCVALAFIEGINIKKNKLKEVEHE